MEIYKTYSLKTTENNIDNYSGRPFITTNGTIYQMLRDLDIIFEVRPNKHYSINLIELENMVKPYSLSRLDHTNIHRFNLFVNPDMIRQLQYGEYTYISDSAIINGKRFELKFMLICRKNYDYDINFSNQLDISDNISDINNDQHIELTEQIQSPIQENEHQSQFEQQPQINLNWANDKIYLLTLPTLEIR